MNDGPNIVQHLYDRIVELEAQVAKLENECCDSDCACRDDDGRSSEPTPWGDLD